MGPELLAVAPPSNLAVRQLYDNYEGTRVIKYISYKTGGAFKLDTLNNASGTGNTSAHVARYTRSTQQYDSFVMQTRGAAINDVTNFKNNTQHMTLKVFSPAPGILFQITLQDSTVAGATNYPIGRNSEYTATTTATNAWETLSFNFVNAPSGIANTGLNEIVLLISPGATARRKVYIDDFFGPSLVGYVATATRTVSNADFRRCLPQPHLGPHAAALLAAEAGRGEPGRVRQPRPPRGSGAGCPANDHRYPQCRIQRCPPGPRPLHLPPRGERRGPEPRAERGVSLPALSGFHKAKAPVDFRRGLFRVGDSATIACTAGESPARAHPRCS